MKTTMKLFGIIALVAIVGFSMLGCIINTGDDDDTTTSNTSLDGTWWNIAGERITISGSTGTVIQLAPYSSYPALIRSAIDKGYYGVGTLEYKSLSKNGDRKWTGQAIQYAYNNSSPNVCTGTAYTNSTFILDSNGQSFSFSYSADHSITMYRY
jgi:hypothetical protein